MEFVYLYLQRNDLGLSAIDMHFSLEIFVIVLQAVDDILTLKIKPNGKLKKLEEYKTTGQKAKVSMKAENKVSPILPF